MSESNSHERRLEALSDISKAINAQLELQQIFQHMLDRVEPILASDLTGVFVLNPEDRTVSVAAMGPRSSSNSVLSALSVPVVASARAQRAVKGELVYEPELPTVADPIGRAVAGEGYLSMVCAPTVADQECAALLIAAWRRTHAASPDDLVFLQAVARHLATAIENKRLYQKLKDAYEELKAAQEYQMQTEKLHALGQMASGIAHDLNNSLSAVIGFTELALEQTNFEKARLYLVRALSEAQQVTHTVRRIQEFSRREPGSEELESVDPNSIIQDVISLTQHRWKDIPQQKGIVIEVKTDLQAVKHVLAVAADLRECLTNLVLNSVEAMPRGGVLMFKTSSEPGFSVLTLTDTGVGMTPETRKRIFDPFFTTKGVSGTGLGLSISYSAIKRQGGDIRVESQPGRGTAFTIRLPVATVLKPATEAATGPLRVKPLRVLVIDDQPSVREAIRLILERDGHRVTEAASGKEGIALFESNVFDIVFTDLGMPEMNGAEVARILHAKNPQVPILLVTGWGDIVSEQEMKQYGIVTVVPKPVRIQQLRNLLGTVFDAHPLP